MAGYILPGPGPIPATRSMLRPQPMAFPSIPRRCRSRNREAKIAIGALLWQASTASYILPGPGQIPTTRFNVASSTDGVHFGSPALPFVGEVGTGRNTDFAPALAVAGAPEKLYIAWTGTDTQHHINVAGSTDGVSFSFLLIGQGAFQGPALSGFPSADDTLLLGWAGTDPNHTINLAGLATNNAALLIIAQGSGSNLGPAVVVVSSNLSDIAWIGVSDGSIIFDRVPL